ncbi:MAG TPA: uroporphyrinogen-III synthase, partial [Trueperaceae bacterium]|nr:uroporphyrinogen-III synthase [Trueperaceae bacterium]
ALTHSAGRLTSLAASLRRRGFKVVHAGLIDVAPLGVAAIGAATAPLLECPALLFASPGAVTAWLSADLPLSDRLLGATGTGTATALREAGGEVSVVGTPSTAAGLAREFLDHPSARGPVALPRGDRALPTLPRLLTAAGLEVRTAVVYRTTHRPWAVTEPVDVVVLASPSAVYALPERVAGEALLVAIGPTTAEAAVRRGLRVTQATAPDVEGIVDAVARAVGHTRTASAQRTVEDSAAYREAGLDPRST